MKRIVVKFGGSNLKSRDSISKLIEVIKAYNRTLVIVISALYGVTDKLIKTLPMIPSDKDVIIEIRDYLFTKHKHILDIYIEKGEFLKDSVDRLNQRIEEVINYLLGIYYFKEIPDFAQNSILSYGERLSSLILKSILKYKGIRCEEILPEAMGLITTGDPHDASIDFKSSKINLSKSLHLEDTTYIIPGFYGISKSNRVTLLGRGGSDYSAAAIAQCIGAGNVDLWKDVSGFMSTDPKLFKDAVEIKQLSYKEAAELSYFGAKILHPRTFEPLIEMNIPIRIFNINKFSKGLVPSTIIKNEKIITHGVIKSISSSDDFAILKLNGARVGIKPGIMARITTGLNDAKINIKSIITAQTSINILFSQRDLKKSYEIIKRLNLNSVDEIIAIDSVSLIAVVGEGMLEKPGIAARVFSAVSSHKINILIISAGASQVATYFIIDKRDKKQAIVAIHNEFFNKIGKL